MTLSVARRALFAPQIGSQRWVPASFDVVPSSPGAPFDFKIVDNNGSDWSPHPTEWQSPIGSSAVISTELPRGWLSRVLVRDRANHSLTALTPAGTWTGISVGVFGDSHANGMLQNNGPHFQTGTGAEAQPNLDSQTFQINFGVHVTPQGNGMVSLLNQLRSNFNLPICGLNTCWGGVPLTLRGAVGKHANSLPVTGCYNARGAGTNDVWGAHLADGAVLGGCGAISVAVMMCGHHDDDYVTAAQFEEELGRFRARLSLANALAGAPPPLFVVVKPYYPASDLANVRQGAQDFAAANPDVLLFDRDGYDYPDGVHLGGASNNLFGRDLADAIFARGLE